MNQRRTVIVALGLVLALLTAFGVVSAVKNSDKRAYKNAQLLEVYRVVKPIPKGLTGEQAETQRYLVKGQIPAEYRPTSAIDPSVIKNKVAINDLSEGQILVSGQFVDASVAQVTFAQRIETGRVAVTVSVDQVHGVAGLLMPGDLVNIMVARPAGDDGKTTQMQVMYQNVKILAIGTKAAPQAGDVSANSKAAAAATGDSGLLTFDVPMAEAQKIALVNTATSNGWSFYLTLVPPANAEGAGPKPAPVDTKNVFDNLKNTPYDK